MGAFVGIDIGRHTVACPGAAHFPGKVEGVINEKPAFECHSLLNLVTVDAFSLWLEQGRGVVIRKAVLRSVIVSDISLNVEIIPFAPGTVDTLVFSVTVSDEALIGQIVDFNMSFAGSNEYNFEEDLIMSHILLLS